MFKGGYKIIDLHNEPISDSAVTIKGIYESIENNHRKPLLLSGIVIENTEKADVFTSATTDSGNFILSAYGGNITITSDDSVTYAKNA